jgi:hypothetical protein
MVDYLKAVRDRAPSNVSDAKVLALYGVIVFVLATAATWVFLEAFAG